MAPGEIGGIPYLTSQHKKNSGERSLCGAIPAAFCLLSVFAARFTSWKIRDILSRRQNLPE